MQYLDSFSCKNFLEWDFIFQWRGGSVGWVSFAGGGGTPWEKTSNTYFLENKKYRPSLFKTSLFNNQPIRAFILGDYEFLCGLYGISGAKG